MILPQPATLEPQGDAFTLTSDTVVQASGDALPQARQLAAYLRPATGLALELVEQSDRPRLTLELDPALETLGPEGYRLEVTQERVRLQATGAAGLFYAVQSLRQLLPPAIFSLGLVTGTPWTIPGIFIEDRPRFGWRGAMLDCARHFWSVDYLERFIDVLALHKLNVFHWHLTDDQGWRLEIKRYPRLTEVGAWRDKTLVGHYYDEPRRFETARYGGFYTQDEVRRIVAYAAARFVTVVPEIELPGHATAAIAAYPELGNSDAAPEILGLWGVHERIFNPEPSTVAFLKNVFSEVLDLFPSRFIHVGGDEVPRREWRESEQAQARMRELGLENEDQLQSYFIREMDRFLSEQGRRLVGWDEILEGGLAEGATVMSWRGEAGGIAAARMGHDVVMTPGTHTYLDHYQSENKAGEPLAIHGFTSLEKSYRYDPIPSSLSEQERVHVLGSQAQLWTEYIGSTGKLEYMALPRLSALSEVFWSPETKDYPNFLERLRTQLERFDALGVRYRTPEALR